MFKISDCPYKFDHKKIAKFFKIDESKITEVYYVEGTTCVECANSDDNVSIGAFLDDCLVE